MSKNILILTGRFGMGHWSAASALKQEISAHDTEANVSIVDVMEFLSPALSHAIYGGFNVLVTHGTDLFNAISRAADRRRQAAPFRLLVVPKMRELLRTYDPDIILSTFPVVTQYISDYMSRNEHHFLLCTCITDISVNAEWLAPNTDLYFVATESVRRDLVTRGVAPSRIRVRGIPVRQCFKEETPVARDGRCRELLVMGGGLGLIPYADELFSRLSVMPGVKTTIITGKNRKLQRTLTKKYPSLNVVGYTDNVAEYMRRADLVVSKAGGITLFEAIHTGTPLYVINPFLLQEIGNARYIEESRLGRVVWAKDSDVSRDILALLHSDTELEAMRRNMRALRDSLGTGLITDDLSSSRTLA